MIDDEDEEEWHAIVSQPHVRSALRRMADEVRGRKEHMKILGMYSQLTMSIKRRVQAPFSVLAKRGHEFSFMQVPDFPSGLAYGYDVTILPNWILSQEELAELTDVLAHGRVIVYDLSDLRLLDIPEVRETLQKVSLVTVPNKYFQKEVKGINSNVEVIPSCVDVDFFWQANREPMPPVSCIGCFGPYHWHLVKDAIETLKEKRGDQVVFLGGPEAVEALGDLVAAIPDGPEYYPKGLHACLFGLCPLDGPTDLVDSIWRDEYGIFSRPTISLNFKPHDTETWVAQMERYLADPAFRAKVGQAHFEQANESRAVKMVDLYQKTYRKKLPHLFLVR